MKPVDFAKYCVEISPWMDLKTTCDGFKAGDPAQDITKAAVSWKASWGALKTARENGYNFFISHESIFCAGGNGDEIGLKQYHEMEREKAEWIIQSRMCVYRCHDTVDLMPEFGIRDQWAKGLGFSDYSPVGDPAYYALCRISPTPFAQLARGIGNRLKSIGQDGVLVSGDPEKTIRTVITGTGAITDPFTMASYKPDCCVLTDDYFRTVREGEFLRESGICMITANHGTSEEWGMAAFTRRLQTVFPEVEFIFIPHTCLFNFVI